MKRIIIILSLIVLSSVSCGGEQIKQGKTEYIKAEEITEANVKHAPEKDGFGSHNFIVNFSNIYYEDLNKNIFILPLFEGTKGNVQYDDLRMYCVKKGYIPKNHGISCYVYECKKGEVKKKLHEMLDFYQEKFSEYETDVLLFQRMDTKSKIDLKKPSEYFLEDNYASFCYYLCCKNGKEKCFTINVDVVKNSPEITNPYEIIPNENGPKRIYLSIL